MLCKLCGRPIPKQFESEHHLVPKSYGGNKGDTVIVHDICHKQIHALFANKVLARKLNTVEVLLEQNNIKRFVSWVQTKPDWFGTGTRRKK